MTRRSVVLGHPHIYAIEVRCGLDLPLLAEEGEPAALLREIEATRRAFDARCFAYAVLPDGLRLALGQPATTAEDDAALRARWVAAGGAAEIPPHRLYARLTSLSGLMQTLLQRYGRQRNRRRATRGSLWARRYRACLLADDTALLAAIAWIERTDGDRLLASSAGRHADAAGEVQLAPPPLVSGPDGGLLPAGEAPPGLAPPLPEERQAWLDRYCAPLGAASLAAYGDAITHGWALGKPESLAEAVARLGRVGGRGRSRSPRDLADDLGLCGVWG